MKALLETIAVFLALWGMVIIYEWWQDRRG